MTEAVDEPHLQRAGLRRSDLAASGVAKTGGHSVDGLAPRDVFGGKLPTALDGSACVRVRREADAGAATRDPLDLVELEPPTIQENRPDGLQ